MLDKWWHNILLTISLFFGMENWRNWWHVLQMVVLCSEVTSEIIKVLLGQYQNMKKMRTFCLFGLSLHQTINFYNFSPNLSMEACQGPLGQTKMFHSNLNLTNLNETTEVDTLKQVFFKNQVYLNLILPTPWLRAVDTGSEVVQRKVVRWYVYSGDPCTIIQGIWIAYHFVVYSELWSQIYSTALNS